MITFLKTILIILLVFFGLKFLIRWATPYLMKYIAKKAGQRFEQAFNGTQGNPRNPNSKKKKEGKVTIDKMPHKNRTHTNQVGDYVDFEEID